MTDTFKNIRHRNKMATMPVPENIWDGLPPIAQLAFLMMESAKFMAAMHEQKFGGFQIVVLRKGDVKEVVLFVGRDEEENSGLVVPEPKKLILPN